MAGLKGFVGASQGFSNSGEVHTEISRENLNFLKIGGFGAVLSGVEGLGLCWFEGAAWGFNLGGVCLSGSAILSMCWSEGAA